MCRKILSLDIVLFSCRPAWGLKFSALSSSQVVARLGMVWSHAACRVGVGWIRDSCRRCRFCMKGSENLCVTGHVPLIVGRKWLLAVRL